jgi:superfamily II DNA or RNA helicase
MEQRRSYQEATYQFLLKNDRCAVTSAAGTGKTRCVLDSIQEKEKALIICPAHLRCNWRHEVVKWQCKGDLKIVSYEYCLKLDNLNSILEYNYNTIVLDECTAIKNWEAKRTENICYKLLPAVKRVIFISATPIKQSAMDLHPILSSIHQDGRWLDPYTFGCKYCTLITDRWTINGYKFVGFNSSTVDELYREWGKISIKFTKEDVLPELPPINEIVVNVSLDTYQPSNEIDTIHQQLCQDYVSDKAKAEHKAVGIVKVPMILSAIEESEDEPTLIFTWHKGVSARIASGLAKMKKACLIIDGDVSITNRHIAEQKFQSGEINFLVLSIAASSTGLNLPRASRVIYAELPFSYADYYQAINRAHRMTTKHQVNVEIFVLEGTIDNAIMAVIKQKKETSDKIIGETVMTKKPKTEVEAVIDDYFDSWVDSVELIDPAPDYGIDALEEPVVHVEEVVQVQEEPVKKQRKKREAKPKAEKKPRKTKRDVIEEQVLPLEIVESVSELVTTQVLEETTTVVVEEVPSIVVEQLPEVQKAHVDRSHALLSPSSGKYWMNCPGQVWLSSKCPKKESGPAAIWGTYCHEQAEIRINQMLKGLGVIPYIDIPDEEQQEVVRGYVNFVYNIYMSFIKDSQESTWTVEAKLTHNRDCYGTGDFVATRVVNGVKEGLVIDLKTGYNYVEVVDNEQVAVYATALRNNFGITGSVYAFIYSPRVENLDKPYKKWELTPEVLNTKMTEIANAGKKALAIYRGEETPTFKAGKHCKWCPAIHICKEHYNSVNETSLELLKDIPKDLASIYQVTPEQIGRLLSKEAQVMDYYSNLNEAALKLAESGTKIPGFKLVGTKGRRSWKKDITEQEIANRLMAKGIDDPYKKSLINLTDAEKVLGKGTINDLLTEPPTSNKLVEDIDTRKELGLDLLTAV